MKEYLKLVLVPTIICAAAGGLLAWVDSATREPIRLARESVRREALARVLPECDELSTNDVVRVREGGREWAFQLAYKDGVLVGAAFEVTTPEGYGGDIVLMVGLGAQNTVQAIEVLRQKETPGLGANIEGEAFRAQFAGRPLEASWRLRKDGGELDQITAATVSSRAVVNAVAAGLDVYRKHAQQITRRPAARAQAAGAGGQG